jgi:hypothetical protein
MPVLARGRRRIHRDDDLGLRVADNTNHALERVFISPGIGGELGADGVIKVDLVQIVDMLDTCHANSIALLRLAKQAKCRTFLGPYGVASALATRDGDHADLGIIELDPLAISTETARLIVGMGTDKEHVQIDRASWCRGGRRCHWRRIWRCLDHGSRR